MFQRPLGGDPASTGSQRDHEFDFVVHVAGVIGVGKIGADQEVVGILLEEERGLARRVLAHFARMGGVVAPDAVDTAHRKAVVAAAYGQARTRDRLDDVGHGIQLPLVDSGAVVSRRASSRRPCVAWRRTSLSAWRGNTM